MSEGVMLNQAMVTKKVSVPYHTISKHQSGVATGPKYPYGTDQSTQRYSKGDLLIGKNKDIIRGGGGNPQETALPSMNGIDMDHHANLRDLQRDYHFVGLNKTDYDPNDETAPKNGLAVVATGTGQVHWTGSKSAFPGDKIVWKFPDMTPSLDIPQYSGKPPTKIPVALDVLDFANIDGLERLLVNYAIKPSSTSRKEDGGGVLDMDNHRSTNLNRHKQTAVLLKQHAVTSAMAIIHGLVKAGVLIINTPEVQTVMETALTAAANPAAQKSALLLGKDEGAQLKPFVLSDDTVVFKSRSQIASEKAAANKATLISEANLADENALLWLAQKLGVVKVGTLSSIIDRTLQKTIVQHLYPKNAVGFAVPKLATLEAKHQNSVTGEMSLLAKYSVRFEGFQKEYRSIFAELYNDQMRYVIGTAYSAVTKGDNKTLDMNFGEK